MLQDLNNLSWIEKHMPPLVLWKTIWPFKLHSNPFESQNPGMPGVGCQLGICAGASQQALGKQESTQKLCRFGLIFSWRKTFLFRLVNPFPGSEFLPALLTKCDHQFVPFPCMVKKPLPRWALQMEGHLMPLAWWSWPCPNRWGNSCRPSIGIHGWFSLCFLFFLRKGSQHPWRGSPNDMAWVEWSSSNSRWKMTPLLISLKKVAREIQPANWRNWSV